MDALFEQALATAYGIWRKKWYGLAVMWVICVAGWLWISRIPDSYESFARIYVDTNSVLPQLLRDPLSGNVFAQVDAMRRTLISRPNLEKVVRRVDLHLAANTDRELEQIIDALQSNIQLTSQGPDLFRISYVSNDARISDRERADLARRVVQNLIAIFFESNIFQNRTELTEARRFLDESIVYYEKQLEQAERRRATFERENIGELPGAQNYVQRLQQAKADLSATDDAIQEQTLIRDELRRQLSRSRPDAAADPSSAAYGFSALGPRIAAVQQQIDNLRMRAFTDQHPDMVAAKRQLEMLLAEQERLSGADTSTGAVSASVYEEIRLKLVDAETTIASLQGRRAKLDKQIQGLLAGAGQVPEIEAEMARLNRDYGVIKSKYEELLASREQARIIQDVDTKTEKVNFRIVDPPTAPQTPVAPNRQRLLSVVLLFGLAGGGGLAFVLSQIRAVFVSAKALRETFALPVLGSVSAIVSDQQRGQHKLEFASFCLVFAALFATYGLMMIFEFTQSAPSA